MIKKLFLFLLWLLLGISSSPLLAQMPCIYPTGEYTDASGPDAAQPSATDFTMRLQLGSGMFNGWTIKEYDAGGGADSCWAPGANPSLVPEYPTIESNETPWTVYNDIYWGPDHVGWQTTSVNYIRQNSGLYSSNPIITNFPCGFQINQRLLITCPAVPKTGYQYEPDNVLTGTIYQYYTQNCRAGVCAQDNY